MSGFIVAYRTGDTAQCIWRKVLELFPTREDAEAFVRERLGRQGYHAVVHHYEEYAAHGLPVGWEAKSVDWEYDHINVVRDSSGLMLETWWTIVTLTRPPPAARAAEPYVANLINRNISLTEALRSAENYIIESRYRRPDYDRLLEIIQGGLNAR